jgi:hypothetical protein
MESGSEDRDLGESFSKLGAISIAEIEKLIAELQETRNFLESEGERIQRETARYVNLTQMASASVRIISDTVSGWREKGHPMPEFEITRSRPTMPACPVPFIPIRITKNGCGGVSASPRFKRATFVPGRRPISER